MKATVASLLLNSTFESNNLAVPKLFDNGSNWSDYSAGSKMSGRHVEGTVIVPKLHPIIDGIPITFNEKTTAMEEQIKPKETPII